MENNNNVNLENQTTTTQDTNTNQNTEQSQDSNNFDFSKLDFNKLFENENFKKGLESYTDKRVNQAVQTNSKKWEEKLNNEKQKWNMSEEELKQVQEQEKQQYLQELEQYKFNTEKMNLFRENNYNLDLLDYVNGSNMDEVKANADKLNSLINSLAEQQAKSILDNKIKTNTNIPKTPTTQPQKQELTEQQINNMTQEQLVAYFNKNR